MTAPERLMDAAEVSEHLHIKPDTVRLWARQGVIPHTRVGRLLRFDLTAVISALAGIDPWAAPQRGRRRAS